MPAGQETAGAGVAWPEELEVDGSLTTQPATGVLLGAGIRVATGAGRHCVRVVEPTATSYLDVTLHVMQQFGIATHHWQDDADLVVEVQGWSRPYDGEVITLPVDASSYTFLAALQAMHGHEPRRPAGTDEDPHPDWVFLDDLRRLLRAEPKRELVFREIGQRPDTFPCLAVLAALRYGRTIFAGLPALRHKESDRIRAMADALHRVGVACEEYPDGLRIDGPMPVHAEAVQFEPPDDHRVVMALALLGTRLPGGVEMTNPQAVDKSWPEFFGWLGRVSEITWTYYV